MAAEKADLPTLPPRSLAQRLIGRGLAYRLANALERRALIRRLPFAVTHDVQLQRRDGRLRLVELAPGITGARAALENRDLVLDLCEAHDIPYFVIPERAARRTRVAVAQDDWQRLVAAVLAHGCTRPLYLGVAARTRDGGRRRWPELSFDPAIARAASEQHELEVFRILAPPAGRACFDRPWSCVIERWDRDNDGTLHAPTRNLRASHVGPKSQTPAVVTLNGRPVRTLEVFTQRYLFEVDFPIDFVYTWVDGNDPAWIERKSRALDRLGEHHDMRANADARFRDGGELRYSMRSVELFAPWARQIFLVTDRQIPSWLNVAHPRIQVIDHTELFGDQGRLPTFNSHAIGARLHHIRGLAEHYIHLNDDFFLGREVWPGSFFQSNGVSKFFLSRSTMGFSDADTAASPEDARRNVADLLNRDFGRIPSRAFWHTPITQRRSTMFELEERYPDVFATTWRNQFRSPTDYEVNSWLHHYYGYLVGKAVPGHLSYDYFSLDDDGNWPRMGRLLRTRDKDVFCVNDCPEATVDQQQRAAEWLGAYYEQPSSFEKP